MGPLRKLAAIGSLLKGGPDAGRIGSRGHDPSGCCLVRSSLKIPTAAKAHNKPNDQPEDTGHQEQLAVVRDLPDWKKQFSTVYNAFHSRQTLRPFVVYWWEVNPSWPLDKRRLGRFAGHSQARAQTLANYCLPFGLPL